jgi:hypothetical protein
MTEISVIFLSCKTNASVYDAKLGHGPYFSQTPDSAASLKRLLNIVFATEQVWARTPDSQPSKVYPSQN